MVLQSSIIDLQAMAMALAACWVAPLHHMTQHKPPATACTFSSFTLLVSMAACLLLSQTLQMVLLFTWPVFTGGTGTAYLVSLSCSLSPCYMHSSPLSLHAGHMDLWKLHLQSHKAYLQTFEVFRIG